jgi:hypothetical protein
VNSRKRCRGGSVLEGALFLPWFIFLFIGALDWGFYAHALISTHGRTRSQRGGGYLSDHPLDSNSRFAGRTGDHSKGLPNAFEELT